MPQPYGNKTKWRRSDTNPQRYVVTGLQGSVRNNTVLTFEAPQDSAITLFFARENDVLRINGLWLDKGKSHSVVISPHTIDMSLMHSNHCEFPYAIYCHETKTFAECNSDPIVIIDE